MPLIPYVDKHSEAAGIPIPLPTATSQCSGLRVTLTDRHDLNPETSKCGREVTALISTETRPSPRKTPDHPDASSPPNAWSQGRPTQHCGPTFWRSSGRSEEFLWQRKDPGTARELCTEGSETHVPDSRGVTPTTWRWSEDEHGSGTERPVCSQTHTQARRCPTRATPQVGYVGWQATCTKPTCQRESPLLAPQH